MADKSFPGTLLPNDNQQLAEYAMVFDMLGQLTGITDEEAAIHKIMELFSMLFAPQSLIYFPIRDGKPEKIKTSPPSLPVSDEQLKRLHSFPGDSSWTHPEKGFLLAIQHSDRTLGILELDGLLFPNRKRHYQNLALSTAPVLALVIANARNFQKLERANQSIKIERDRTQRYLDMASVMLIAFDRKGLVTLINQKGCEVMGYEKNEIIGRNWFETFVPDSIRPQTTTAFENLIANNIDREEHHENPVFARGGKEKIIAWHHTILRDESGYITGVLSSGQDITAKRLAVVERERLIAELQEALSNVKTLSGLIPICASCKKIRDDRGYWNQVEAYIGKHSDAKFSHGICPDCAKKLYPELFEEEGAEERFFPKTPENH